MRAAHHSVILLLAVVGACSAPEPTAGDSCRSIDDCVSREPLACLKSACVRLGCSRSIECPAGAACVSGRCAPAECESDDDCPGTTCFEGDCRADVCEFKAQCDPGEVCIGSPPTCTEPPARCSEDRECPADRFCKLPEGVCEPQCTSDASCAAGSYCDGAFCRLACETGVDCGEGRYCVDGRCIVSDCEDRGCPDAAPFVDPVECRCVECLADRDCSSERNERCTEGGTCLYCPTRAEAPAACQSQGLVLVGGCCVECAIDGECPAGNHCERGRCVLDDPRECVVDTDCPAGSRCDLGWCVLPGSMTPCEIQSDCPNGEACYSDGRCRAESPVCADCPTPSRCVAEPGDDVGTCAGCPATCGGSGCGASRVCYVPPGGAEGYCVEPQTLPGCD